MKTNKKILDACCGSRMFWFDKNNPDVLFADIKTETISAKDSNSKDGKRSNTHWMAFMKKNFEL